MEAHVNPATPLAVERLRAHLLQDNARANTLTVEPGNFSHARTEQTFVLTLVGKRQILGCLFRQTDAQILELSSKRSGAIVRTTISIKIVLPTANTLLN